MRRWRGGLRKASCSTNAQVAAQKRLLAISADPLVMGDYGWLGDLLRRAKVRGRLGLVAVPSGDHRGRLGGDVAMSQLP